MTGAFGYGKGEIAKTTDKGRSWNIIQMEIPETERPEEGQPMMEEIGGQLLMQMEIISLWNI